MSSCLSTLYSLISSLWAFVLPYGITFGALVCSLFGLPLLVKAFKGFF